MCYKCVCGIAVSSLCFRISFEIFVLKFGTLKPFLHVTSHKIDCWKFFVTGMESLQKLRKIVAECARHPEVT